VLLPANTTKEWNAARVQLVVIEHRWKHLPAVSVPYSRSLMDQVTQKC
jgi:hypothetical protein